MRLDAETAHEQTLRMLSTVSRSRVLSALEHRILETKVPNLPVNVFGKRFRNPVGLAAGFDKDAVAYKSLSGIGFGFVELGTVTPEPQPGNPRKRLFRVSDDLAIINRLGFNSSGLEVFRRNLQTIQSTLESAVIGINIGKNTATPNDLAIRDYLLCLEEIYEYADYIAINVSSPNSPHLRELQSAANLDQLLDAIMRKGDDLAAATGQIVPIALKVSPDLDENSIVSIADIAQQKNISAIIATNTTVSRPDACTHPVYKESGGLSGKPLSDRSTQVIRNFAEASDHNIPIIGVGGIFSAEDAWNKLQAGASLIQIYSSLIYRGPSVVREIVVGISERANKFDDKDFGSALKLAWENYQVA